MGMVTIILALAAVYFLSKGMLKLILRGAEDYSHGVRSFSSLFFRGVGVTIMDSGAAGALAIAGLLLYWVNMVASTVNPVAYGNYPLLKWLLWGAGILFLLAAGFAVFRSLRCMCIVGLMIIVGSVLAEVLNLFILHMIDVASNIMMWTFVAFALLVYFVGPFTMMLAGIVLWLAETLGVFGPILAALFCAIAVVIMPLFTNNISSLSLSGITVDWRALGLVLVCLFLSLLLEKRTERGKAKG